MAANFVLRVKNKGWGKFTVRVPKGAKWPSNRAIMAEASRQLGRKVTCIYASGEYDTSVSTSYAECAGPPGDPGQRR